jgi:hypothetical protein
MPQQMLASRLADHHNSVHRMMKKRILSVLMGSFLLATQAAAQQVTITGRVTRDENVPLSGVSVVVAGTRAGHTDQHPGQTTRSRWTLARRCGSGLSDTRPSNGSSAPSARFFVQLEKSAASLDAVVVTALGQTATQRSLGVSQQTVDGF